MEQIVRSMDYVNPTKADEDNHHHIHDHQFDEMSMVEIENVLLVLCEKLRHSWPQRCKGGYFALGGLVTRLKRIVDHRPQDAAEQMRLALYPTYIKLFEACILGGFSASHVDFMKDMIGLFPWKEDKTSLTVKHFRAYMDLLKLSDFIPPPNDEQASYVAEYGPYVFRFFIERVGKEFIHANVPVAADYTHFISTKMWSLNETAVKFFRTVQGYLYYAMNQNIYKTIATADPQLCIQQAVQILTLLKESPIPTEQGIKDLENPLVNLSGYFRDNHEFAHSILPVFVDAWLDLGPLQKERPYLAPICERVALELRVLGRDAKPVVYKDAQPLLPKMKRIMENILQEDVPTERKQLDDFTNILDGALNFLGDVTITKEDLKVWFDLLLKFLHKKEKLYLRKFKDLLYKLKSPALALFNSEPKYVCELVVAFQEVILEYGVKYQQVEHGDHWMILCRDEFGSEVRSAICGLQDVDENKKVFVSPEVQEKLIACSIQALSTGNPAVIYACETFFKNVMWKKASKEDIAAVLGAFKVVAKVEKEQPSSPVWTGACYNVLNPVIDAIKESMPKIKAALPHIKEAVEACVGHETDGELLGSRSVTFEGALLQTTLMSFMLQAKELEVYKALYPSVIKLPPQKGFGVLAGAHLEDFCKLLDRLLEEGTQNMLNAASTMCYGLNTISEYDPGSIVRCSERFCALLKCYSDNHPPHLYTTLLMALHKTAAKKTELHTPRLVEAVGKMLELDDKNFTVNCLNILNEIAKETPILLFPVESMLVQTYQNNLELASLVAGMLQLMACADPKSGERIFQHFDEMLKLCEVKQPAQMSAILNSMRQVAVVRADLLASRQTRIQTLGKTPALHDICQHLLDVIAERNLANLDTQLGQTKARVEEVRIHVDAYGRRVDELGRVVDEHGNVIADTVKKVDATEARVSDVEVEVNRLEVKVDEVDQKTMSNAPKWSRDVTLLLNPEAESDWRLLARRLNYTVEDVRTWATQADPCMALLSEWFATHRGVEATRAVLTQLKEMGREDAAHIVEMALTAAESVAADEEPPEFLTPPSVFLSYQWGHQAEVKVLRHHLEKAGYRCWMDIGQMGGGDKLFEALDRGIRGAKVLVACINEKYCASDNCKREINLAVNLGKPLIPLQLERVAWPPPGTLGPLLAEYLFIRMFTRANSTNAVPGTFWPAERFQELLMQIRYHCPPEYDLVHSDYANWWAPPELPPVLPMRIATSTAGGSTEKQAPSVSTSTSDGNGTISPQIFLSYQWDKQQQVRLLYSRLTSLGRTCWMDIYQMGGGDSLYDKIDRGVRNCRLVIACVTPKYALSINCRREISLADALKKPIVPLMLESMTWPPEGPMSMALTQLMYIQLSKEPQEQSTWDGPKTEELLRKIHELCGPAVSGSKPSASAAEKKVVGAPERRQSPLQNGSKPAAQGVPPRGTMQVAQHIGTKPRTNSGTKPATTMPAKGRPANQSNAPK